MKDNPCEPLNREGHHHRGGGGGDGDVKYQREKDRTWATNAERIESENSSVVA